MSDAYRQGIAESRAALAERQKASTRLRLATLALAPESTPPIELGDEKPRDVDPRVAAVLDEVHVLRAENRRLRDDLARVGRIVERALDP